MVDRYDIFSWHCAAGDALEVIKDQNTGEDWCLLARKSRFSTCFDKAKPHTPSMTLTHYVTFRFLLYVGFPRGQHEVRGRLTHVQYYFNVPIKRKRKTELRILFQPRLSPEPEPWAPGAMGVGQGARGSFQIRPGSGFWQGINRDTMHSRHAMAHVCGSFRLEFSGKPPDSRADFPLEIYYNFIAMAEKDKMPEVDSWGSLSHCSHTVSGCIR